MICKYNKLPLIPPPHPAPGHPVMRPLNISPPLDFEPAFLIPGLKITAGHRTMSGQDDYLLGQNLGLAVILTAHVRGFQIIS